MSTASSTASSSTEKTTGATKTALLETTTTTTTENLSIWQEKATAIAASFVVDEAFRPFLTNRHVQTILSRFLKDTCAYVPPDPFPATWRIGAAIANKLLLSKLVGKQTPEQQQQQFWHHRERIETPDDDWFHADYRFATATSSTFTSTTTTTEESLRPIVLLLYGVVANSYSPNVMDMAQAVNDIGMDCVCLNYRGCSGTLNNHHFGGKHLGFTQDLHHYLELLKQRRQQQQQQDHVTQGAAAAPPIYLAGFSMGGNIVLKCLGELGERAVTEYNIQGAAVWCPPLDQTRSYAVLEQPGIHRWIYSGVLLQRAKQSTMERLKLCWYQQQNRQQNKEGGDPSNNHGQSFDDFLDSFDLFNVKAVMAAQTLTEFDDHYHRGVHGFANVWDFYRQSSSIHYLHRIAVPTVVLGALDDPLFDPAVWPVELSRVHGGGTAPLRFIRTAYGGHLGYCFHQVDRPDDPRLLLPVVRDTDGLGRPPSWGPVQLARFFQHVENSRTKNIG